MIDEIKKYITIERDAVNVLLDYITEEHVEAINVIKECKGRVIFVSVGKGSYVGRKLAASWSSLGIPSFFVHATEACHGDLGMIRKEDVVIMMSNSGKTKEVLQVIDPIESNIGAKLIAFTSNKESELAKRTDYLLLVPKYKEADDLDLAPTSSTTMTLVLGDAIGCYLSHSINYTRKDFFKYHPNGAIGEALKEESKQWEK